MTTMNNDDPALPEVGADEAWYDAEIAPALNSLAKRCHERGMSFVAAVEYQPGDRGGTYYLTEDAGISMQMIRMCAMTAPNVDSYIINLTRYAKANDVDVSSSMILMQWGRYA